MKNSILLAIVILAIGAVPRLLELQRKPVAAAHSNVLPEPPHAKSKRDGEALAAAAEWIGYFKERENSEKQGGQSDALFEDRFPELSEQLDGLDAYQFKRIIAEVRNTRELSADSQSMIISAAISRIAAVNPEMALELFLGSAELLGKREDGRDVLSTALALLAARDPQAAAEWIRKNAVAYAENSDDGVNLEVISAVAGSDPQLAFKLLGELKFEDSADTFESLVEAAAVSPENRGALLLALRGHMEKLPEETRADARNQAFGTLARNLGGEDIDGVARWISKSDFTAEEAAAFAAGLSADTTKEDTGRWIDWIAATLPAAGLVEPVSNLVGEWTSLDYQAAGKWLASTSEGPAKHAAVLAYAGAVAEYEPLIAGQWATTLPPGSVREEALRMIYRKWPVGDPEGAAAFAREHGME